MPELTSFAEVALLLVMAAAIGLVGTLAGDDTIFLACRDRDALRRIRLQFEALRAGEEVS